MARTLVLIVLAGCGRIGFGATTDARAPDEGDPVTVDLNDGVTMDSYVGECAAASNFGGANHFHAATSACLVVALMRFELAAIPPQSVVADARLQLFTYENNASSGLHALYPIHEEWVEGMSDDSGELGVPNWTERMAAVPWTTPGCGPGSRSTNSMGSFSPPLSAAGGDLVEIVLDVAIVQAWIDGALPNHGMAITNADATTSSMTTSDHVDPALRPTLVVTFSPP